MGESSIDIIKVSEWGFFPDTSRPLIISGPCSAETEDQMFETAMALKGSVQAVRAGIWKPRTHPGCFEGVGSRGLEWLVRIRKELGMKVIVEVANPVHIEAVLKAGLDMIWIGTRTTTNPFAMQDISEALRGIDIPVFVKNPINPDVELWMGALERLNMVGIKKLAAIHRGFSFYEKSKYRNIPKWQVPIEIKRRIPDLLMLCDPSHISGKREYIAEISQQAMDLGFDGLFIESHINPECALSDADQQISPAVLKEIIASLILKNYDSKNSEYIAKIEELRSQIDMLDDNILALLSARMSVVEKIGQSKKYNNITILQPRRWEEILEKVSASAIEKGLDKEFVAELYKLIHQASIDRQSK